MGSILDLIVRDIRAPSSSITTLGQKKKERDVSGNTERKCRVGRSDLKTNLNFFFNMKVQARLSEDLKINQKRVKIRKFLQNCIKRRRVGPVLLGTVRCPETNPFLNLALVVKVMPQILTDERRQLWIVGIYLEYDISLLVNT